ncbi:MAG: hypothetical protein ACI9WU_003703 [Myxococcota bacterium]|jgi:hypothetical protein
MDFERTHKVVVYLLVSTGFLVLFLSGELPVFIWAIGIPAILGSMVWGGKSPVSSTALWNTILIAALGGLFALALSTGDWLRNAIYFACLMVVAKLYQRMTTRDYYQLYALSFLQLVSGAVINPTISFAICFLAYVVFLTWALVLLHLRRDMDRMAERPEEAATDGGYGSRRMRQLIGPGFLAGTSILALGIFMLSVVVFLFFPRLGLGFFGQHRTSGTSVSGFDANGMELGSFGRLKLDRTIVMRVEIDGAEARSMMPLRMKGISFDDYNNNTWTKTGGRSFRLNRQQDGFIGVRHWGSVPDDAVEFTQRVFLENLTIGRKTIFGEARLTAVRDLLDDRYVLDPRKRTRFSQDHDEDVVFRSRSGTAALRYEVKSTRIPRHPEQLREADPEFHRSLERYLQLPDDLDPRMAALAREVTAGKTTDYDRVEALEAHLLRRYAYSLEGGHDADEPLADFLFGIKTGHCEYFSSALVVMARSLGIPARPVGGFYGGQYNDAGDYIAMRQADAHSWVEVWFQGYGWQVFDPTPSSGALIAPDDGILARMSRYLDSMQMLWYKWVIRWDLERQLDFMRGLGKSISKLGKLMPGSDFKLSAKIEMWMVYTLAGLVFFIWLVVSRKRIAQFLSTRGAGGSSLKTTDRDGKIAKNLYKRLLKVSARRGVPVTPSTSSAGVIRLLRDISPAAAEEAAPVVQLYEDVVFGGAALSPGAEQTARTRLKRVESS